MTIVNQELIYKYVYKYDKVRKIFEELERNKSVQSYLKLANLMAVTRLKYNDHGVVHSRIVSGAALELHEILTKYLTPSIVRDKEGDYEDSKVVTLCIAYLHDIGNAIHRINHHIHGVILANRLLDKILSRVYKGSHRKSIKMEILHGIFSHDESVQCLTIEAGISKVADGLDMAEGRARIPYKTGKVDIHALSALAIKRVEIEEINKSSKYVQIKVHMQSTAGVFQIEEVLLKKVKTSGIEQYLEIIGVKDGDVIVKI